MNGRDPELAKARAQAQVAPRHVSAAFAVYLRQHCGAGYFSITETIKAISGDAPRSFGLGSNRDHFCYSVRHSRRAHRTHDEYGQRVWQGAGFACRCDHIWRCACLLALIWGFHFLPNSENPKLLQHLHQAGAFVCFLFLIGGVSRLARFNISHDAQPRNPGAQVASILWGCRFRPPRDWLLRRFTFFSGDSDRTGGSPFLAGHGGHVWIPDGEHVALLVRQGDQFLPRHPFQLLFVLAIVLWIMWRFSNVVFFGIGITYMFSGIWARAAYGWSRRRRRGLLRRQLIDAHSVETGSAKLS